MARVKVDLLCNPLLLCELGVELVDEERVLPRHDGVGVTLEDEHLGHSLYISVIGSMALSSASSMVAARMAGTSRPRGEERYGQPAKEPTPLTEAEKATWN